VKRYSIICNGITREYLLYAPPSPRGLVVFLHGKGGTASWADNETGWSRLALREGFALALPEAMTPDPLAPPKFLTNPPQWNDGSEFMRDENHWLKNETPQKNDHGSPLNKSSNHLSTSLISSHDDTAFLTAVIDHTLRQLDTQSIPVFIAGFSNGAGMTFRFAAEKADRVEAIAAVAGHCWVVDPKPSRPVPTLYVVGTVDPLIPLRGGAVRSPWLHRLVQRPPVVTTLETWAQAIGCSSIPITQSEINGVRTDIYPGPVPFQSVTIEGLGHHWPSGKGLLNHKIAGPPSNAVNGTELVWEFFKRFI
jgi:polyhydroxybutyrate depolymerase